MELEIQSNVNGRTLTLYAIGKLNTTTSPELEACINDQFRSTLPLDTLVLDLSRLTYLSSAGLRVLMSAHKTIMKQRYGTRSFIIQNPSAFCMQVFETVGVDALFKIRNS